MINLEIFDENKFIISNIEDLSCNEERDLKIFLNSNLENFQNFNFKKDEICFFIQKKLYSLNILEKYLQKNGIMFNCGKNIISFKNKQNSFKEDFDKLKQIGSKLKLNNKFIHSDFIDEYEKFKKFCKTNFSRRHIPYENQIYSAFFHLKMRKSCNFSDPGTGKTTIVYTLFNWLKNKKENEIDAIFIIGPISSFYSWKKEYEECFKKIPKCIDFQAKSFSRELKISNPHNLDIIYFLNYDRVHAHKNDLINFFEKYRILLVLDEAHRIKNPSSKRFKALSKILNNQKIKIQYQLILTGTPNPNGYKNLYSYFNLIRNEDPKILSKEFKELEKIKNDNKQEINEIITEAFPFFYTLRKDEMENFKIPNIIIKECEMEEFQKEIFNKIKKGLISSWEKDKDKEIHLEFYRSKLIRLMQIQTDIRMIFEPVNNIIFLNSFNELNDDENLIEESDFLILKKHLENKSFDSDMEDLLINSSLIRTEINNYIKQNKIPIKYNKLLEIINNLINKNEKVIIWSNWVFTIIKIQEILNKAGFKCGLLYGAVDKEIKETLIEEFNDINNKNLMILVANPASVAESISLHKACQNAIYFDINYNVTNHFQSKDRIHRYGMPEGKEEVTYYYLLSKESLELKIFNHLISKEKEMRDFKNNENSFLSPKDNDYNSFIPDSNDISIMNEILK